MTFKERAIAAVLEKMRENGAGDICSLEGHFTDSDYDGAGADDAAKMSGLVVALNALRDLPYDELESSTNIQKEG